MVPHADAAIGDGQRARGLVGNDPDPGILGQRQVAVGQGFKPAAIRGVGGIGDELAQEDLPLRVERMDHEIEQASDLGPEFVLFRRLIHV
jgi:hypothetical protein